MNIQKPAREKKSPKILCIGMPVRDLIFRVPGLPDRGSKEHATEFIEVSGGNSPNASVVIARLGGRVALSGPIGGAQEKTGAYIYDQLAEEGIDTSGLVRMDGLVTPISTIMIDPSGERTIITYRDSKLWAVKLPPPDELLAGCDAVLIESRCADLKIEDVPSGSLWRIDEYDGRESVMTQGDYQWKLAL